MPDTDPAPAFRFRCLRSGNCCSRPGGMVRVSASDIARLADHLGLSEAGFRSRYVAATGDRLSEGLGGRCVFLREGRPAACAVYPVRPERCRSWPHWDELRRSRSELERAARVCPGLELEATASRSLADR